jgi:hypothetical protein
LAEGHSHRSGGSPKADFIFALTKVDDVEAVVPLWPGLPAPVLRDAPKGVQLECDELDRLLHEFRCQPIIGVCLDGMVEEEMRVLFHNGVVVYRDPGGHLKEGRISRKEGYQGRKNTKEGRISRKEGKGRMGTGPLSCSHCWISTPRGANISRVSPMNKLRGT